MTITAEQIKNFAEKAQATWGDYGIKPDDTPEVKEQKLGIQVESLKRMNEKLAEGMDGLAKRLTELEVKFSGKVLYGANGNLLPGSSG